MSSQISQFNSCDSGYKADNSARIVPLNVTNRRTDQRPGLAHEHGLCPLKGTMLAGLWHAHSADLRGKPHPAFPYRGADHALWELSVNALMSATRLSAILSATVFTECRARCA